MTWHDLQKHCFMLRNLFEKIKIDLFWPLQEIQPGVTGDIDCLYLGLINLELRVIFGLALKHDFFL